MSDESEKPFEATPQRIAKAKREGNVARSAELGANCAFAVSACCVVAVVPVITALARNALVTAAAGTAPYALAAAIAAIATLPILAAALAGVAAAALQHGAAFLAPVPKWERLNPVEGCKRLLSRESLAHGARAMAAFAVAAAAMVPAIRGSAAHAPSAAALASTAAAAWSAAQHVAYVACGVGTLFAVAEYAAARKSWLRKLRMSFEERKREIKEQEGDPLERGRRRTLHRSLLRGRLEDVKKATFVLANPTHVAVALRYAPPKVAVPTVLVRAAEDMALRVRALARRHDIPVVENATLARALYRDGRIGRPIDAAHFVAVAEVVAALSRSGAIVP